MPELLSNIRRRFLQIGLALLVVGAATLAIYPARDAINQVATFPEWIYLGFLILGLLVMMIGLAMFVAALIPKSLTSKMEEYIDGPYYDCRPARKNELRPLRTYSQKFFGDDVSTLTKMKQWHNKNPNIYWLLFQNKSTGNKKISKMVGYYNVLPLTEEASVRVAREELNGTLFNNDHIVEDSQKASSIYIGAIAANFRARNVIRIYLEEHLKREQSRGVVDFYTRPVTKRGLQLVEDYNFLPVDQSVDQELYRIYKSVDFNPLPEVKKSARQDGRKLPNMSQDLQEFDFFISHASEDKDTIARPLYLALTAKGISVWFDEATLKIGDSLRRKIDEGLVRCRYGIVILSPQFFAKEWARRELDGLVARETSSGEKAILPVWHEVDAQTVSRYSPTLADRVAARSSNGVPEVVEQILGVLNK